ncbi:MAG: IgGFc-binding protein, partial [Ferruginibacter sp.]
MKLKTLLIIFLSTLYGLLTYAQDKSNRGKEFWLAYGFDYSFFHESPVNEQELAIYISAVAAANVTVTVTNTGYTQTLNIPANTVNATILIPKSGPNDARTLTDGLQNRGIHIVSDTPVAVYAHVYATQVSGATMLMPVETYGYLYHSINYNQATSNSSLPVISPTTANGADWYSWFYAIASEDNTRLEITPSDTTKNGWLPGQTYTVNLNKGESYHVFGKLQSGSSQAWAASKDMTGSKLVSVIGADGNCHPVAVFSGSGGIRLCRGDGGEFMHQQVFPAQAWGTRYLTYHTINNTNSDILETNRNYYRVCVADPTTIVKKNGAVMTGLIKNFFYEYMDSTGGDYIEADKPILVSQYTPNKNQCWNFPVTSPSPPSYGDPEMFYLSPIEQGQKAVLFYTSRKSGIDYVYANIHFPTAAINSLKVDGNTLPASQIIPHPNLPSYSVALARFIGPAAQHNITCDSTFNATVYGLGNFESYGYNVGTLINNLNFYGGVRNTFSTTGNIDSFTCLNTPARIFAKLAFPALTIHWKLSQVPGMTPNTDSIINNPVPVATEIINGRTYYVYTLQQDFTFSLGAVSIPIAYTSTVIPNCFQTENAYLKLGVVNGPKADFNIANLNCLK